jgi:hypothetical protein
MRVPDAAQSGQNVFLLHFASSFPAFCLQPPGRVTRTSMRALTHVTALMQPEDPETAPQIDARLCASHVHYIGTNDHENTESITTSN